MDHPSLPPIWNEKFIETYMKIEHRIVTRGGKGLGKGIARARGDTQPLTSHKKAMNKFYQAQKKPCIRNLQIRVKTRLRINPGRR